MLLWADAAFLGWGREVKQAESFSWAVPKPQPELVLNHTSPAFCVNPHSKSCLRGWLDLGTTGRNRRWIGRGGGAKPGNTQKPPSITWLLQQSKANPFSFNKFQLQISQLEFGLLGKTFGNERSLLENFSPTFCSPPGILKDCDPQMQEGRCWRVGFFGLSSSLCPPWIAAGRCRVSQQANMLEYWGILDCSQAMYKVKCSQTEELKL